MRNHLYFYSSNLEQIKSLKEDDQFQLVPEYNEWDANQKSFRNEYGRIKTKKNFYHFLFGRLSQTNCPWCGGLPELKKVYEDICLKRSVYCIHCSKCDARGPSLNIDMNLEKEENFMEECKSLIWNRYNTRRAWDENFVNPYES